MNNRNLINARLVHYVHKTLTHLFNLFVYLPYKLLFGHLSRRCIVNNLLAVNPQPQ